MSAKKKATKTADGPRRPSIGQIIRRARLDLGWSQTELARRAGIAQQTVSAIEAGEQKKMRSLPDVARALGRSTDDLLDEAHPNTPAAAVSIGVSQYRRVPIHGSPADADALVPMWVLLRTGVEPDAALLIIASGDPLPPAILRGDYLLVDTAETTLAAGTTVAVDTPGGVILRTVQARVDGTLILQGANGKAEEVKPRAASRVPVIGRVVWRMGRV